jgi:leader peptidase (prepilin peptidase)/N-methyltransferase
LIGSFLGWQPTLVAFFLAPFFAMLVTVLRWLISLFRKNGSRETYIPYGPYLSLGALCVILGWKDMWPVVGRWFSAGPFVPLMGVALLAMMVPALMMIQLIKRILGIPLYPENEMIEEWTSADTLMFLAGEVVERDRQQWANPNEWQGTAAAQGTIHEERWRSRDDATGWRD